jgi:flagellar biosynthetic protein FliR
MKLGLGLALGSIMALSSTSDMSNVPTGDVLFGCAVAKEFLFGSMLGLSATLTFSSLRIAGHLIGEQMGFNMASIQDPITGVSTQVTAHFLEASGLIAFLAHGGDHILMRAFAASFEVYEVGNFTIGSDLVQSLVIYSAGIFLAGLQIAAPVFGALFLVATALAILSRVAPQLHVMQFAFPVKVLAGLLLLTGSMHVLIPSMAHAFNNFEEFLGDIITHG